MKPAKTARKPTKVLVVEDSQTFAVMLRDTIYNELGFQVDVATTLAETKLRLAQSAHLYFAAVVDLHLPDAPNGEAVAPVVDSGISCLVFTGSEGIDPKALWEMGIADYVHKNMPFSLPYIIRSISRLYSNEAIGVLVVDDMASARAAAACHLHAQRFQVFEADSAKMARTLLAEHQHIKIIILDHFMPGMDGISFCGELHARYSMEDMDVIGMSGQGLATAFLKAGAIDFLYKPFTNEELLCRINHSAERLEAYERFRSLNELKNRFLGMAAHDLRNPIAAIRTTARLLAKPEITDQRRQNIAEMIEKNARDVIELLENLLDISAIESGHIEIDTQPYDLNKLIKERLDILHIIADEKGIKLNTHLNGSTPHEFDKMKLAQVIDNLISNAIKYSPANSTVEIKTQVEEKSLRLQVIDSGPGIAEEDKEKLFTPFCTLDNKSTGGEKQTGLGLCIAKSIVEAHDGEIFFQRTTKGQSRFVVYIAFG